MSHFIKKCSCGKVIAQCRCPNPSKSVEIIKNGCNECKPTQEKHELPKATGKKIDVDEFVKLANKITEEEADWEKKFDNGVALKIGKAGKSEGVTNVRQEIKAFIKQTISTEVARAVREAKKEMFKELKIKLVSSYDQTSKTMGWYLKQEDLEKLNMQKAK